MSVLTTISICAFLLVQAEGSGDGFNSSELIEGLPAPEPLRQGVRNRLASARLSNENILRREVSDFDLRRKQQPIKDVISKEASAVRVATPIFPGNRRRVPIQNLKAKQIFEDIFLKQRWRPRRRNAPRLALDQAQIRPSAVNAHGRVRGATVTSTNKGPRFSAMRLQALPNRIRRRMGLEKPTGQRNREVVRLNQNSRKMAKRRKQRYGNNTRRLFNRRKNIEATSGNSYESKALVPDALMRPNPSNFVQKVYDDDFPTAPRPTKIRWQFDPPNIFSQGYPRRPTSQAEVPFVPKKNEDASRSHQTIPEHAVFISPPPSMEMAAEKKPKLTSQGNGDGGKWYRQDLTNNIKKNEYPDLTYRLPIGVTDGYEELDRNDEIRYHGEMQEDIVNTRHRVQPATRPDSSTRGRYRPEFNPSDPIDPDDYRFYSFVTDSPSGSPQDFKPTRKPAYSKNHFGNYQPKRPHYQMPPLNQNPYEQSKSEYATINENNNRRKPIPRPQSNSDYNNDFTSPYVYPQSYPGYPEEQGVEIPPEDDGGFGDDDDEGFQTFPNTFTLHDKELQSYSIYEATNKPTKNYNYRPPIGESKPDTTSLSKKDKNKKKEGGGKPFAIGLDVYPVPNFINNPDPSNRHHNFNEEKKHEVIFKLNLFSKKPSSRAEEKEPQSVSLGPFSYANGRQVPDANGRKTTRHSLTGDRRAGGNLTPKSSGDPKIGNLSNVNLDKLLFGNIDPVDLIKTLVKSNVLKEHPTVRRGYEYDSEARFSSKDPRYSLESTYGSGEQVLPPSRHRKATVKGKKGEGSSAKEIYHQLQQHRDKINRLRIPQMQEANETVIVRDAHKLSVSDVVSSNHTPPSNVSEPTKEKEDYEYVYYYYYDYLYPEDLDQRNSGSEVDFEVLPEPLAKEQTTTGKPDEGER